MAASHDMSQSQMSQRSGVRVGLKVGGGLDDDAEGPKEEGGALGLGLEEDAAVTENNGDGLEEVKDSGSLGAWGDDFDEIGGLDGVGLEEYVASLDEDCGSQEEDVSGIWEDIGA
ncbi:hypothetical protein GH714_035306 [Hevea brasiliensis]|uniref:Uncharacterized protein n=1 Tax=Hevea brasiliensis TaxID=3981 RepID=A0A6A6L773_HEVBR|nr:hypothetical protein GH714_035306 [Hevea brasiliensis]